MWYPRRIIVAGQEVGSGDATSWERYEGNWEWGLRAGEGTKYGRNGKFCIAVWEGDKVKSVTKKGSSMAGIEYFKAEHTAITRVTNYSNV